MSKEFFLALGFTLADLRPLQTTIGTAQEGAALAALGRCKHPLYLQPTGLSTKFKTFPVVIDKLTMPFIIGAPFLHKHGFDQLHSQNQIRIQGHKLPLIASLTEPHFEKLELTAYTSQPTTVPPLSQSIVPLHIPDIAKGLCPAGDGFLTGTLAFMGKTDLHPVLDTMVRCDPDGTLLATVLNTTSNPISLKSNMAYGSFRLARFYDPQGPSTSSHPWRVLALANVRGGQDESPDTGNSSSVLSQKSNPNSSKNTKDMPTQKDLDDLIHMFRLDTSPFLKDSRKKYQAAMLLYNNRKAFSFDGSFGKTTLIQHQIHTEHQHKPINQKYRPVNPALEKDLKEQIRNWMAHGIIEKSNSPWNFGLVAAPKKNGKIRWCVDYRALNKITTKDSHPIGNIDDNLSRLSRSIVFSCIDGSGAYHVVQLDPKDKDKTAFATPWGSYQFTHMPFGLCNAPSTYARLVQMVLQGIPYHIALPYLDDTIVHSKTVEEHFQALEQVLHANIKAGLKLSPEKCFFFQSQVAYLGHVVSAKGIQPNPEYLKVVANWPVPTTRAKVRTFLGKTGYYRRFIKNYAKIAEPLLEKLAKTELKDTEEFDPTQQFDNSFQQLKKALLNAPILAYPRFDSDEPFILDTDWSAENNAVGAVLSQKQDGLERVICYGAKRLTKAQAAYSPTKGELAGVIIFMQKWKYFLQHRNFLLRTDHRALCWIQSMVEPTGMIQRWLDLLSSFDFKVEHRPGPKHGNADALSRAEHLSPASSVTDLSEGEKIAALATTSFDIDTIKQEQQADPDLSFILPYVRTGDTPPREAVAAASRLGRLYAGLFDDLKLSDKSVLMYTVRHHQSGITSSRDLVLLPRNLWTDAIWKAHEAAAHMASHATVTRALQHFYFPGMTSFTERLLRTCTTCQTKVGNSKDQRALHRPTLSGYPFRKLSLDFVGPLPVSSKGNCYILTVLDTFTRWLEAFPLRAATADRVVNTLIKEVFSRYGLCEQLHSDRGSQFTGDLLTDVAKTLGISHTQTPSYNPKSNPVERQHRTLQQALTALVDGNPKRWEQMLPHALFAMRTTVSRSTGFAPFQLMFGRDASSNLDLIFGAPHHPDFPLTEYATRIQEDAMRAHHWARQNIGRTIARQRRAYQAQAKTFEVGHKVWLFTPRLRPGQSKKFATYWTGPWTITRRVNELMMEICPDSSWLRKSNETVSIDRLKPFFEAEVDHPNQFPPSPSADLSMAGDEYAEHLLDPPEEDDHELDFFLPVPGPVLNDGPAAPADAAIPPPAPAPAPPLPPPMAPPPPPPAPLPPAPAPAPPLLAPPRSRSPSPGRGATPVHSPRTQRRAHPYARDPTTPPPARQTPTERERERLARERLAEQARLHRQSIERALRHDRRLHRGLHRPRSPPPQL